MINFHNKKTKAIIFGVIVLFFVSPIFFFINQGEKTEHIKENSSLSINIGNDHYAIEDISVLSEKDSVGEDFFSVSKNLIIDERLKGNLFAFGELITIESFPPILAVSVTVILSPIKTRFPCVSPEKTRSFPIKIKSSSMKELLFI